MKKQTLLPVLCLLGAAIAAPAGAASITYRLDRAVGMPEGAAYVEVVLTETSSGGIDFDVSLLPGSEPLPDGAGIREFAFNVAPGSAAWWKDVTDLDDGWRARPRERNAFGIFDIRVKAKRRVASDTLEFSVTPDDGSTFSLADLTSLSHGRAPEGHAYFSASLVGMASLGGRLRATLGATTDTTVVPLPATAWLLASALGMAGALARRRGAGASVSES